MPAGCLQIGPESAGSDPGPVAYGRGNTRPTVTDANIVLGRIDPDQPLGEGLGKLDLDAAKAAIAEHIGAPLKLDVMDAAEAIVRVANSRMAGAIRLVSIERGFDPERFVFMPFGGGGALHAGAMIEEVGIGRALVPRYPGVTSALGCVIADMRQDFVQTLGEMLDGLDLAALTAQMQAHHDEGMGVLDASGLRSSRPARRGSSSTWPISARPTRWPCRSPSTSRATRCSRSPVRPSARRSRPRIAGFTAGCCATGARAEPPQRGDRRAFEIRPEHPGPGARRQRRKRRRRAPPGLCRRRMAPGAGL
jgi:hypothetical protein